MFSLLRYGWNTRTFAQLFSYWVCVCEWLSVHVVWVIVLVRLRLCNYVFGCGCECVSECVNISIFGCSEVILFTAVWSYMNNACMYNYCAKDEWFEVLNLRQISARLWHFGSIFCSFVQLCVSLIHDLVAHLCNVIVCWSSSSSFPQVFAFKYFQ